VMGGRGNILGWDVEVNKALDNMLMRWNKHKNKRRGSPIDRIKKITLLLVCLYYTIWEIISYSQGVITPMCISLDLGRIWLDKVYVNGVYHRTRPYRVLYMSSMQVYLEYMAILILYATVIVLNNILKNMVFFEKKFT
jgi:hypothetical protein